MRSKMRWEQPSISHIFATVTKILKISDSDTQLYVSQNDHTVKTHKRRLNATCIAKGIHFFKKIQR